MMNVNDIDAVLRASMKLYDSLLPSSRVMEMIERANRTVSKMLIPYDAISRQLEVIQRAIGPHQAYLAQIEKIASSYDRIVPSVIRQLQLSSAVFETLRIVEFTVPKYLAALDLDYKGMGLGTREFASIYDTLLSTLSSRTVVPDLAPALIVKPGLSIATHYRTLKSLGFVEPDESDPLDEPMEEATEADWSPTEALVASVDERWLLPLKGAEESMQSGNPDRVRHTTTSLRELLTTILHTLAPDVEVRKLLPDAEWYHDGRPTRRARIRYILEERYQSTALLDFVDKDIDLALEMFTLFQKGTHEIVSSIKPNDLRFIVARTKLLIGLLMPQSKSVSS
jgi:hypothetical protein